MRFIASILCAMLLSSCMVTHELRIKELEKKMQKMEKFRKKANKRLKSLEEPG